MGTFELILLLIAAVLISTLVSQISSKISTPLVQIAIGILIALFVQVPVQVSLDPDIFLVIFIAPLLFNEAKNIDRLGFWQNKGMIISLALGLVVATMLAVGFSISAIMPALPIAAALALGAALGPTDAVAVSSMSGVAELSPKQKSILSGESLINDASGLVAFQFAITLAVTGEFSLAETAADFALEFFGGLAFGCALGWLCNKIVAIARNAGLVNRRFHVLFEVALPFAAYMLGDSLHVSGVLAVVACGIVFSLSYKNAGVAASKTNIVSNSVWDVFTFALNGIVFVLLGMMLPSGMLVEQLDDVMEINWYLIGGALIIAAVVIACRFIWVLIVERVFGSADEIDKGLLRHAAILSCAGAKGAVTLSIVMTTPYILSERNDMIFMASVAILITLLVANFAVPILSPAKKHDPERQANEYKVYARILRQVIERLTEEAEGAPYIEKMGYQTVISEYGARVDALNEKRGIEDESFLELRCTAMQWQGEYAKYLCAQGKFSEDTVIKFVDDNDKKVELIKAHGGFSWMIWRTERKIRTTFRALLKSVGLSTPSKKDEAAERKALQVECNRYVVNRLQSLTLSADYKSEDIATLLVEYQKDLSDAKAAAPSVTQFIKGFDMASTIRAKALSYEQEYIGEAYSDGLIDRQSVAKLRRQVSAMQLDTAGEI